MCSRFDTVRVETARFRRFASLAQLARARDL